MAVFPRKSPSEIVDYGLNWINELADDTITASVWAVVAPATVTLSAAAFSTTQTSVRVAGGAEGESAEITNTITLSSGEIYVERCTLKVESA